MQWSTPFSNVSDRELSRGTILNFQKWIFQKVIFVWKNEKSEKKYEKIEKSWNFETSNKNNFLKYLFVKF